MPSLAESAAEPKTPKFIQQQSPAGSLALRREWASQGGLPSLTSAATAPFGDAIKTRLRASSVGTLPSQVAAELRQKKLLGAASSAFGSGCGALSAAAAPPDFGVNGLNAGAWCWGVLGGTLHLWRASSPHASVRLAPPSGAQATSAALVTTLKNVNGDGGTRDVATRILVCWEGHPCATVALYRVGGQGGGEISAFANLAAISAEAAISLHEVRQDERPSQLLGCSVSAPTTSATATGINATATTATTTATTIEEVVLVTSSANLHMVTLEDGGGIPSLMVSSLSRSRWQSIKRFLKRSTPLGRQGAPALSLHRARVAPGCLALLYAPVGADEVLTLELWMRHEGATNFRGLAKAAGAACSGGGRGLSDRAVYEFAESHEICSLLPTNLANAEVHDFCVATAGGGGATVHLLLCHQTPADTDLDRDLSSSGGVSPLSGYRARVISLGFTPAGNPVSPPPSSSPAHSVLLGQTEPMRLRLAAAFDAAGPMVLAVLTEPQMAGARLTPSFPPCPTPLFSFVTRHFPPLEVQWAALGRSSTRLAPAAAT